MLATRSVQIATRAQLQAISNDPNDLGTTTPPTGFTAPTFHIACSQRPGQGWAAVLHISQKAEAGTNAAYHLGPGLHSTGLSMSGRSIQNYVGGGARRVYYEVSQGISNDSRDAEQEHLADIQYAFDITLGAVQAAVDRVRSGPPIAGFAKQDKAVHALKKVLIAGLDAKLAAIVKAAISDFNGAVNQGQLARQLGQLYVATADKTQDRDAQGWHFFDFDRGRESGSVWSWTEYLAAKALPTAVRQPMLGELKDIRTVIRGQHWSVNVTPSARVISMPD